MTTSTSLHAVTPQHQTIQGKRGCLFYIKRGLLALIILIIALPATGFVYETVMAAGDAQRFPAPGQLVSVDGRQMHIRCVGEGSPTVILESGLGGWSDHWSQVQPAMGQEEHRQREGHEGDDVQHLGMAHERDGLVDAEEFHGALLTSFRRRPCRRSWGARRCRWTPT